MSYLESAIPQLLSKRLGRKKPPVRLAQVAFCNVLVNESPYPKRSILELSCIANKKRGRTMHDQPLFRFLENISR